MALQINVALTAKDGGAVATGSYVKLESLFPMDDDLHYYVSIKLWRSKDAYDNGLSPLMVQEIPKYNYNQELTQEDFDSLTPLAVHQYAKTWLEQYTGADTVTIV